MVVGAAEEVVSTFTGARARVHAAFTGAGSGGGRRSTAGVARFLAVLAHVALVLVGAVSRAGPCGAAAGLVSARRGGGSRGASSTALFAGEGSEAVISGFGAVSLLGP